MASRDRRFWDRKAEGYSKTPIADEATYQKKLEVTQGYFRPDMEVLELGCGTGSTALVHAPHVRHIRAVDLSSSMIDIAQKKAEAQGIENITFEQASIDELEAPPQSFDAVLALSVLHLLEDKDQAISMVYGLLKPGGIFVTSTPCIADSMKFFKVIAPIGRFFGVLPSVKVFSKNELLSCLTGTGFEIDYEWQADKRKSPFIVAVKPS